MRDLVEMICQQMVRRFEDATTAVEERPGQDAAYIIDSSRARTDLDWSPQIGLKEGLAETISWIEKNWDDIHRQPLAYQHIA